MILAGAAYILRATLIGYPMFFGVRRVCWLLCTDEGTAKFAPHLT